MGKAEVFIDVRCLLNELEDKETADFCKVYDRAPSRVWRHLDTMHTRLHQLSLLRIKTSDGKVKTIQPSWAFDNEGHTYLFEQAVIDLLKASKIRPKLLKLCAVGSMW